MKLIEFIKKDFSGFTTFEKIFFPSIILFCLFLTVLTNDRKIVLLCTICSMGYTILAGKGRISCYFIGLTGSIIYSFLAYSNTLYGSFLLYIFYYIPSEIVGIFQWKKHLKKDIQEVAKKRLSKKEKIAYFILINVFSLILSFILKITGDIYPFKDGFVTFYSIFGQLLTVKRCSEQWLIWFFVNFLNLVIWIKIFKQTQTGAAFIFMWGAYLILSVYFFLIWQKETKNL